jgi:putative ubiquitin-RnfH superfamily antitoxin RatB of RatAB toxin-antitoxin module
MAEEAPNPARIRVEVAWAEPRRQFLRRVELPAGATLADALSASGIEAECGIDASVLDTGIWSSPASRDAPLHDGDRVELYRPLRVDPREARRRRAAPRKSQP